MFSPFSGYDLTNQVGNDPNNMWDNDSFIPKNGLNDTNYAVGGEYPGTHDNLFTTPELVNNNEVLAKLFSYGIEDAMGADDQTWFGTPASSALDNYFKY